MEATMRLIIGSIMHESNTFFGVKTDLNQFIHGSQPLMLNGQVLDYHRGQNTELGGFIHIGREAGAEIIPTLSTFALPGGMVTAEAYQYLKGKLMKGIQRAGQIDGVYLALHGSMVAEGAEDADGELIQEVRTLVGHKVFVACSLDYHACVSDLMAKNADFIAGYKTSPHIDNRETGERAANALISFLKDQVKPTMAMKKLPALMLAQLTTYPSMKGILNKVMEWEAQEKVIAVSLFAGFARADIQKAGASVVAVTDNDLPLAKEIAEQLGRDFWELRQDPFVGGRLEKPSIDEAISIVLSSEGKPYVLNDIGDMPSAGAAGDGNSIIKVILERDLSEPMIAILCDPESVDKAIRAGVGKTVDLQVGGKMDTVHFKPVRIQGAVRLVSDGRFIRKGPRLTGLEVNMGRSVVIRVKSMDLVLTEKRVSPDDPEAFRSLGIEPLDQKIIVLKGGHIFAAFEPISKKIIEVDTEGWSFYDLRKYPPRKNIPRPIFPLDDI
jgi:microcystin degradation protein MlrC